MAERVATITALAGTNGAGKSSIIGAFIRARGGAYYNPDEAARILRECHPHLKQEEANIQAWNLGREGLEAAIAGRSDYVFETTLGGTTIPMLLGRAARKGIRVTIWYIGLNSAEEHIRRVGDRVQRGGHDIPEHSIRERFVRSRENLVSLMPHLYELKLFDNSASVDMAAGERPLPRTLLHLRNGHVIKHAALSSMPQWARPLIAAARGSFGLD